MPENAMAKCDAQKIKPFYGKPDSPEIRYAILAAIAPKSNVRYLKPGSNLAPDPESDRLNVMIDVTEIIRDARCG